MSTRSHELTVALGGLLVSLLYFLGYANAPFWICLGVGYALDLVLTLHRISDALTRH